MRQLFELIYRFRAFFIFMLMEVVCLWLIIQQSEYHNAAFFNTSNSLVASVFKAKQRVNRYFFLVKVNNDLVKENAYLRELIRSGQNRDIVKDTVSTVGDKPLFYDTDSTMKYEYIPARVINNSFRLTNNFITINKGRDHGVKPEMGVISSDGIVGQVKAASRNYATIYSVLHSEMYISSMIKRIGVFCTTKWQGGSPVEADILYVPRHVSVQPGDSIVTSGYNAIFPPGVPIGKVESVEIAENETFYDINISLFNDFTRLSYVYLIKNNFKTEKDSLEMINE